MNPDPKYFIAVKGLVFDGDKFLIIKRSAMARSKKGFWELPGGRLEFGETPEIALHREIQEEAGIEISIVKLLNSWILLRNNDTQTVGLTYLCIFKNGKVQLSQEHEEFAVINKDEIDNYNFYPAIIKDLKKYDWNQLEKEISSFKTFENK